MWTSFFCASFGAWQWYGNLTVLHLLMITGTLVTGFTFRAANNLVRGAFAKELQLPGGATLARVGEPVAAGNSNGA